MADCKWCSAPLDGPPAALPLGGDAVMVQQDEAHAQCFDDMLEDWQHAGVWRAVSSVRSKLTAGLSAIIGSAYLR